MNDAANNPDASIPTDALAPTPAKKPRGRPAGRPAKATPETPQQRIERLEAELQQAREAAKVAEQQRDSLVGSVVVRHALAHADFRRQLSGILKGEVKSKADLAVLAELLT